MDGHPQWPDGPVSATAPGLVTPQLHRCVPSMASPVAQHRAVGVRLPRPQCHVAPLSPGTTRSMPSALPAPTASASARTWPSPTSNSGSRMSAITRGSPGCPSAAAGGRAGCSEGLLAESALLSRSVPPNLRSSIYCSIVAVGGEEAWDFMWERFRAAPVVSEGDKLRTALSCSPIPWILNRWVRGPAGVPWGL